MYKIPENKRALLRVVVQGAMPKHRLKNSVILFKVNVVISLEGSETITSSKGLSPILLLLVKLIKT
jgi:hypothetical protein